LVSGSHVLHLLVLGTFFFCLSMAVSRIARYLRDAAYTFAGYAIAGGLMVPAGSFSPASWLNHDSIIAAFPRPSSAFPPMKWDNIIVHGRLQGRRLAVVPGRQLEII